MHWSSRYYFDCPFRPTQSGTKPLKKRYAIQGLVVTLGLGLYFAVDYVRHTDAFSWPESAKNRIEEMAEILRRIEAPASWCYPATSAQGNIEGARHDHPEELAACFAKLAPTSDYNEKYPREYIGRYYGAEAGGFVCEVTLSTNWNEDSVVGSPCYYGFFPVQDFPGLGATDEPFG